MENTVYYKVTLNPPPKLHFLKTYRTNKLNYLARSRMTNACEIISVQEGRLTEVRGAETTTWEKGSVHVLPKDKGFRHLSGEDMYQPFEVGLIFDQPLVPMSREDLLRWIPADNEAILVREVRDQKTEAILNTLIKQAVSAYTSASPDRFLSVRSTLSELFLVMTNYALDAVHRAQDASAKNLLHCRKACAYIAAHLAEPLSVRDVAKALDISPNYLSKLFSPAMNMSVTEYIHRAKMLQVAHLITDGQMTLSAAAAKVGIGDSKYLSRLFRRYMGMSAAQYKKLYR